MRAIVPRVLALIALLALLAGCQTRSQESPAASAPGAELLVTEDFGAAVLLERRVPPDQSVLRALRGATDVETGYGGGFVVEMLGRRSDAAGRRDWFFYVDGVLTDRGAADVDLGAGQKTWWDYRDWSGFADAWAVVGQWPAPFAVPGGLREVSADQPLAGELRRAGAVVAAARRPWRVAIGSHGDLLARDPAWRRATANPARAGMTAWIDAGEIVVLGPTGARPLAGARAVAVAVPTGAIPQSGVLMAVAGLDEEAASAAARRIAADPAVLSHRFAVVFDADGAPIAAGGRGRP